MSEFKLFDIVALKEDLPEEKLYEGQVGTIVEVYNGGEALKSSLLIVRAGHMG